MMLPNEQEIIENLHIHYNKYYVPFVWASTLVVKSRRQGLIKDDFAVQTILDVPARTHHVHARTDTHAPSFYRATLCYILTELSPVHTSNNVEATFDFVEATFDYVASNGNNVERLSLKFRPFDIVEC